MGDQAFVHPTGQYRFAAGIAPYSAAVRALPGHVIRRVLFRRAPTWNEGLQAAIRWVEGQGRPGQSICSVELRSPAPFTFQGFIDFNKGYRDFLTEHDMLFGERNPIARTNVAPVYDPPAQVQLYAFGYTVPAPSSSVASSAAPSFVVAGAGDLRDQGDLTGAAVVRPGETDTSAMIEKADCVLSCMDDRLAGVDAGWADASHVNIFTAHPIHFLVDGGLLSRMGAAVNRGLTWHLARPPIADLEFEMDVRGGCDETMIG